MTQTQGAQIKRPLEDKIDARLHSVNSLRDETRYIVGANWRSVSLQYAIFLLLLFDCQMMLQPVHAARRPGVRPSKREFNGRKLMTR